MVIAVTQNTLSGQITIGVDKSPTAGALLQLKGNDEIEANSTKGLGMPRVSIVTTTPIVGQLAQSIESSGTWNENDHIGLAVYNVNKCVNGTGSDNGLYVWDGTIWQNLRPIIRSSEVSYFTDIRDTEVYPYRSFGNNAGVWMLENMRYIDASFTASTGNSSHIATDRFYTYPNGNPNGNSTPADIPPSTWEKRQGLIYSYAAATLGEQDNIFINQSEGDANGPSIPVQGICPSGWHIPSDSEWNKLEEEIYNNPGKYSTYSSSAQFNPSTWNSSWNTSNTSRGSDNGQGHGFAMQSPCQVRGAIGTTSGTSLPTIQGGFNVLVLGQSGGVYYGKTTAYGVSANFWTSSTNSGTSNPGDPGYIATAWFRSIYRDSTGGIDAYKVEKASSMRSYIMSVRCKRDY